MNEQMKSIVDKRLSSSYTLLSSKLTVTTQEKELDVTVNSSLCADIHSICGSKLKREQHGWKYQDRDGKGN